MNAVIRTRPLLGTLVSIQLQADTARSELLEWSQCAFAAMQAAHTAFNFHSEQSELTRVNAAAANGWAEVSTELLSMLQLALKISALSGGVFDVCQAVAPSLDGDLGASNWKNLELDLRESRIRFHAPLRMDLGGIAKGFAVDQAARNLPAGCRYVINAGGDLRASPWQQQQVEIRLPEDRLAGDSAARRRIDRPLVTMQNAALATSSDEAALRLVNPGTGTLCARSPCAYSVFAPSCMLADALTKVLRLHPDPNLILCQFGAVGMIAKPGESPKFNRMQAEQQCA